MRWIAHLRLVWRRLGCCRPQPLGLRGERLAARYLRRQGYTIVARQQRGRFGELDLVAVEGRTIVFVEVKTRRSDRHGHPAESVGHDKQRRLTRAALAYLRRHHLLEYRWRFDIIAILWPRRGRPRVEHLRDAFPPTGKWQMFS